MFYVYLKDNDFPELSLAQLPLPLIAICETSEHAESVITTFSQIGRSKAVISGSHHFGQIVGKQDDSTLLCVECVEYEQGFPYVDVGLSPCIKKDTVPLLYKTPVRSTPYNVATLEQGTHSFTSPGICIWWDHQLQHL